MIQKFKLKFLALALMLMMPVAIAVPAYAAQPSPQNNLCYGVDKLQLTASNATNFDCAAGADENKVNNLIQKVINVLSAIVGVIAVIMIIIGGFRYITSGGAADKVTAAKNTILYGLIGLVIVALAQIIVKFVFTQVTSSTG